MPRPGTHDVDPPEKLHHTANLNAALADALRKWDGGAAEVVVRWEATISPNPGGIGQYRVILEPK